MKTSHDGKKKALLGDVRRITTRAIRLASGGGALAIALLTMATPAISQDMKALEEKFAKYKDVGVARITDSGTVVSTNVKDREITFTESFGSQVALKVDQSVPDLDKLKAGDSVRVVYFLLGTAEVREPTAEEKKNPNAAVDKKTLDENPYGKDTQVYRAVTTIEGLDRAAGTVTFKGPKGYKRVVKVKSTSVFDEHKIGDTVVITYAEPVAMWLAKTDKAESAGKVTGE